MSVIQDQSIPVIRLCAGFCDRTVPEGYLRCPECQREKEADDFKRWHQSAADCEGFLIAERERVAYLEAKASELTAERMKWRTCSSCKVDESPMRACIFCRAEQAKQAVAAERERIAKIADDRFRQWSERAEQATTKGDYERRAAAGAEARHIAEAIRRGE